VSDDNLRATVIKAGGGDASGYGPTYDEVTQDADVVRKHYFRYSTGEQTGVLQEFDVTGDANDFANWHLVREIPVRYWY